MQRAVTNVDPAREIYWSHAERRTAVNLEHVHNGRLEFRQAAGTLNSDKIEYWIRFLFEFIDDTARIMSIRPTQQAAMPAPAGRRHTPRFRQGSRTSQLYELFEGRIVVSAEEAALQFGWTRTQFTDTVASLRMVGVPIRRLPQSVSDCRYAFNPTEQVIEEAVATSAMPGASTLEEALQVPFLPNMSEAVKNWVAVRKSVFSEDAGQL